MPQITAARSPSPLEGEGQILKRQPRIRVRGRFALEGPTTFPAHPAPSPCLHRSARRLSLSLKGRGGRSLSPCCHARRGFTLIELLVAMSIFVIVSAMTIGAINLSITGEQVRGAARQVQSKLEGARDRAIYNSKETKGQPRPVGVRLLVDPDEPTICRTMVYIESPGRDESDVANAIGVQAFDAGGSPVLLGVNTNWANLYDRGLIGPGSVIVVENVSGTAEFNLTIHPDSFPIRTETDPSYALGDPNSNGSDDEVLQLLEPHPDQPIAPGVSNALEYYIELNPDIMADEEPLELSRRVCIDLETSHLPDGWNVGINATTLKPIFSNRMDIMFSAQGQAVGEAAAAGIIHLHVVDFADALEDTLPGSPTTPLGEERHGNELGLTIFTKAGRVISHPISTFDSSTYPSATWMANTTYNTNDEVAPVNYNGLYFRAVRFTGGGGMGNAGDYSPTGVEPDWSQASGGITLDNEVFWLGIKHDVWEFGLQGEVAR